MNIENLPEQLSSLTIEEANQAIVDIDARIAELEKVRNVSASLGEILSAKDEIRTLKAKKADISAIVASAQEALDEATPETQEEVKAEETQEEVKAEETQEEIVAETEEVKAEEEVKEESEEVKAEDETQEVVAETEETTVSEEVAQDETPAVEAQATEVDQETTETVKEAVAASLEENGDKVDNDIDNPSESTALKSSVTASIRPVVDGANDAVEAVTKVARRELGGEAFKTVFEGEGIFKPQSLTVDQQTDYIMSLQTPGREDPALFQKQYANSIGTVAAAFCQPPERIDNDVVLGGYQPTIVPAFASFIMEGLQVETWDNVDSTDADFVGEVALVDESGDPLESIEEKACYEAECITRTTWTAQEVKACLTANEQTAFTAPRAIQGLIQEGNARLTAKRDAFALENIIDNSYKFQYNAHDAGYAEVAAGVSQTLEAITRQDELIEGSNYTAFVPASMFSYFAVDHLTKQFSMGTAREAAAEILGGVGINNVVVYHDALDATNLAAVPSLSKTVDSVLARREDWTVLLVDTADAVIGLRNENEYSLQSVPQSITELRQNKLSWFARSYQLFALRKKAYWAAIDFQNLCIGGRVVAGQACI